MNIFPNLSFPKTPAIIGHRWRGKSEDKMPHARWPWLWQVSENQGRLFVAWEDREASRGRATFEKTMGRAFSLMGGLGDRGCSPNVGQIRHKTPAYNNLRNRQPSAFGAA
jgi:hypothetical protein